MCISHLLLPPVSCMLLLLVSTSGEGRPHVAQEGTPRANGVDSRRVLLLEAVKSGILSSLGLDREPRPTRKASELELAKMYQLYREKLREMRGNSSQPAEEAWTSSVSTVLFPVKPLKVLWRRKHSRSGHHMRWYRALFQKNPNIRTELSLARAELRISRQVVDQLAPAQSEVKVKVNRRKPTVRIYTYSVVHTNTSSTEDVVLDVSPEVEAWMKADGRPLVVDVGMVLANRDALDINPTISLELGLTQAKPAERSRPRRSNKEDECDERGWCCRKSISVSFKDIGWTDWVVAPAEYTMHFCDGACPHNYKPASMHAQVKSRLHQISGGATPRPCCVPAAYEPMVLMHYDSRGKLKLTPFDDLIVSKCHCA
ncbi:growth/differentiation factor 15 [Stegastes partitus]|uniref:Growth/differentiation factor 15 n=1 Tax=Stegastes partitus TaxID=144197 RepID=A0A9Y4K072_9TELE|nr:PREDICTED: growth/differentiation factor 15 [Stegastes partitus]